MTVRVLSEADRVPPAQVGALRLMPVGPARWRVLDPRGRAMGHLDSAPSTAGVRFRASRYHAPSRAFRVLGEFWSATEAVECLRLSR